MGIKILEDPDIGRACLYCSTSEYAFGPLFDDDCHAQSFLNFIEGCGRPQMMSRLELDQWHSDWLAVVVPCKYCETPTTADSDCCDETCKELLKEKQNAC